ncbi:hypothetical protein ABW20_dc0108800 [Dactylellina cionopaga]|nr:hypothetical protein ABW20_dc0108800 [Dactylellina cionopaga]
MPLELKSRLNAGGNILAIASPHDNISLDEVDLKVVQSGSTESKIMLIHRSEDDGVNADVKTAPIIVLEHTPTALGDSITEEVARMIGQQVKRISFDDISQESALPKSSILISLLEIGKPLLAATTELQFRRIKLLTDRASCLIWVTSGHLLNTRSPDHSLAFGLSRSVMVEQPSLRFFVYDVDDVPNPQRTARNIVSIFKQVPPALADFEYAEKKGTVYVSRIVPDDSLNEAFRQAQETNSVRMPLEKAQSTKLELSMKALGQLNSALSLQAPTKRASCLHEFSGIVKYIGSEVTDLAVGDRVYVMAPGYFRTLEIVPQWACHKLEDSEAFNLISTLPFAYATAMYALYNKAGLHEGETILIHSGASDIGMAAISLAQLKGARIYTTVDTEKQKHFLTQNFGITPGSIFNSYDSNAFENSFMEATNGAGADVVLSSLREDLLGASWRCCNSLGRFVEIGTQELPKTWCLEAELLRGITYTVLDLTELYNSLNPTHQKTWTGLMKQVFRLYREKKISGFPLEEFDIEVLPNALRRLGSGDRIGKVAGDVCFMSDVEKMIQQVDSPIGGVVQAAMGLSPALFSAMDNKSWLDGIDPKIKGSWNIHNAINGKDSQLDFFLCTSSISGSIGSATESNYCAANHFLDNFAHYRRSLGLPATSVGLSMISEVGFIHENPDIEELFLRKGIQQLDESEIVSASHGSGFKGNNPAFKSARTSVLARATYEQEDSAVMENSGLPAEISKARASGGVDLFKAITIFLARQFGEMVLMPVDKVNVNKPLDGYGMDSMIAAEFRSWFYQIFKLDVPYLELLSKTTTVENLSKIVLKHIEAQA